MQDVRKHLATTRRTTAASFGSHPLLDALTGVRFFAAFAVLARHFQGETFANFSLARDLGVQGFAAVSFFFVLSGFVLAYSYLGVDGRMRGTAREFWSARFARIYPAYLVAFLTALPLFAAAVVDVRGASGAVVRLAVGCPLVLMLIQSWTPWTVDYVNSPAWSLSVEAAFYVAAPRCFSAVGRLSSKACLVAIVALWGASLAPPAVYLAGIQSGHLVPSSTLDRLVQCFPPFRLAEFLGGAVLGRLFLLTRPAIPRRNSTLSIMTIAATILAVIAAKRVPEPLVGGGLLVPPFLVLIWTLATEDGLVVRLLGSRPLLLLGEISYGIYILQQPAQRWFERLSGWEVPNHFFAFTLVLIGTSWLCFELVEKPTRGWIKTRLRDHRRDETALPPDPKTECIRDQLAHST
jgi:peptidoglycan/LPS O-acetylase OafA/YrhL